MNLIKKISFGFVFSTLFLMGTVAHAQQMESITSTKTVTYPCYPETEAPPRAQTKDGRWDLLASIINWMNSTPTLAQSSSPSPSPAAKKCIYPTEVTTTESYTRNRMIQSSTTYVNGRTFNYGSVTETNVWFDSQGYGVYSRAGAPDQPYYLFELAPRIDRSFSKGSLSYSVGGYSTVTINRNFRATLPIAVEDTAHGQRSAQYEVLIGISANRVSYDATRGGLISTPVPCNLITSDIGTKMQGLSTEFTCIYSKIVNGPTMTPTNWPFNVSSTAGLVYYSIGAQQPVFYRYN